MAAKDRASVCTATSYIYKNRRKFDNSKRLICEFVLSGDVVCFQRRGVRHNANDVAYAQ